MGFPALLNVIFLLADDWGYGDVNGYGNWGDTHVQTPNLDRLFHSGLAFTDGHSLSPVCSPSRVAHFTGRFPGEVGFHTATTFTLNSSIPNVAQMAKKMGYRTAHYGKWHMGGEQTTPSPAAYGLDDTVTFNSAADLGRADWPFLSAGIAGCNSSVGLRSSACAWWSANSSAAIINHTLDFIGDSLAQDKPFYINSWLHVSHAILAPTPEQLNAYPVKEACRLYGQFQGQNTCPHQIFWAAQHDADVQIGRLLDFLDLKNLTNNTLIAFSTDNGPEEMMVYVNAVGSAGPFRGRKRSLYEGGTRLPFIYRLPGTIPAGISQALIGAVDFLPTLAAAWGQPVPSTVTGEDLSQVLLTGADKWERTNPLFWEWRFGVSGPCHNVAPQLAIRQGKWKLLLNPDFSRVELYFMVPHNATLLQEGMNLADANPDVVAAMAPVLLKWYETKVDDPIHVNQKGCHNLVTSAPLGLL